MCTTHPPGGTMPLAEHQGPGKHQFQRARLRRQAGVRGVIPNSTGVILQKVQKETDHWWTWHPSNPLLFWSPLNRSVWNMNTITFCFYLVPRPHLVQWFSQWGPLTSSISCTWKLGSNSNSQAPTHTYRTRNSGWGSCGFNKPPRQCTLPLPEGNGRESRPTGSSWMAMRCTFKLHVALDQSRTVMGEIIPVLCSVSHF